MKGGVDGASFGESCQVGVVVISGLSLPASEQDADPFESQAANDGVIFFALGGVIIDVVASPLALGDRETGKFMKGLPVELGTGSPDKDRFGFATTFGHWSDSGKALDVIGALITGTVGAKEGEQPGGHGGSGARQLVEQIGLRMSIKELLNARLILPDADIERLDQLGVHLEEAATAFDDGRVNRQCLGHLGQLQYLFNDLRVADIMPVEKAFDRALLGLLEGFKSGPFFEEVTGQAGTNITT